ncbi:PIG-L family deacetylase [Porifericola rhodea]|uniref:PIG-L deacetylase family protein n=1 Tax=Porifericola rhodea TaxID=930972 RepID=UPI002664FBBC|nr:PIG-L deacetylase family protein [Porifericola rhodea]WKN31328.1 PIG-L family deacetylase [Porifericola rhodea]
MASGKKNTRNLHERIEVPPVSAVYEWGTTLVVASRPDKEIIGCSGAIALLRQMGYRVHVVFMCNNLGAYQASNNFQLMCSQPECCHEAICALSKLGISQESITFLDTQNYTVPQVGQEGFKEAVKMFKAKLNDLIPDTVLLPWTADSQQDHHAVWSIAQRALQDETYVEHLIEYAMKPWVAKEHIAQLDQHDKHLWKLDNKSVLEHKLEALSQFQPYHMPRQEERLTVATEISSDMMAYLTHPWELYLINNI